MTFKRPVSKLQIVSLKLRKTSSLVVAPALEAPDHRQHRQCIGLTYLPGVVGQKSSPPRGFFDYSLDCTQIVIGHTR